MRLLIVTPAPSGSPRGHSVTAHRWAGILRRLGHDVCVVARYGGEECDVLIALHARRSHPSILEFRRRRPQGRVVLALVGADVYEDLGVTQSTIESLEAADRLICFQELAVSALPAALRSRARVVYQSTSARRTTAQTDPDQFEISVIGHLRPLKDPFRAVGAVRMLPSSSRVSIVHVGAALSREMEERARAEERATQRYRWLGGLPREEALRVLARSRLTVLSSLVEGGPNVLSEAIVLGVPVVATSIPGLVGVLGESYPGLFTPGDTRALSHLLWSAEQDPGFYAELARACERLRPLFDPDRERRAWAELLQELASAPRVGSEAQSTNSTGGS
jgi:putative glycosyltransferase (TIGR04348 family)